jgi:hypothetical protein
VSPGLTLTYELLYGFHYYVSLAALGLFWIPLALQKGGEAHQLWGRRYLTAVFASVISAIALTWLRLRWDPSLTLAQVHLRAALLVIEILTLSLAWHAWTMNVRPMGRKRDYALAGAVILTSLMGFHFAYSRGYGLLLAIAPLACALALLQIGLYIRPAVRATRPRRWRFEHVFAMIGTYVAMCTAMMATMGRQWIGVERESLWVWLPPALIVLGMLALIANKLYRTRRN